MRSNRWSFRYRAVFVVALVALLLSVAAGSFPVAFAQTDDQVIPTEGSPTVPEVPSDDALPTQELPLEDAPVEAIAPVLSLVEPNVLIIDATRGQFPADPCAAIEPAWISVPIDLLLDQYWISPNGAAGGALVVDGSTTPPTFGWDASAGGTIGGVLVPDWFDDPAVTANFYDYRPFDGAIGGDAGLTAPNTTLTGAFLCLAMPPAPATQIPLQPADDIASPLVVSDSTVTDSTEAGDGNAVEPAAIAIGSIVLISEPLNLRESPSLSAGILTVLSTGTQATVIGGPQSESGYTWWQLSTPDGTGWSVAAYLAENAAAVTATSTLTPTLTPATSGGFSIGETIQVRQRLNLRASPGTSADVITVMPSNTLGTVLEGPVVANGLVWWRISTSLGTGWAAGNYLLSSGSAVTPVATRTNTPVSSSTATRTATPTLTASRTSVSGGGIATGDQVQTTTKVNLRAGPGTQAAVIVVLPTGSQGTVAGGPASANGLTWWQLQSANGSGWVAAPYIARIGVAATATGTKTPTVSPTASRTRTPAPTRTQTLTPTRTLTPSITPTVGQCGSVGYGDIVRTNSSVNFRATASTSGTIIRTLSEGERGTIRGGPVTANGYTWCQVQIGSATGWIANQYLTRVSGPVPTPNGTPTPRPGPPGDPGNGSASVIYRGSASSGMIALTFDAGADRGEAEYILDLLAQYGVHATFGMTGTWARDNPDLVARMVAEGHQLINHTWSHPSFTGGSSSTTVLTRTSRLDQLDRAESVVEQQTGYQMQPYWRPPYGDIDASVLRDVYAGGYYLTVMWSCDTLGWDGATEQQILNRCMYPMGAGDIILMHVGADGLDWAAADDMIRYFQNQGLQIVTVEELLAG